MDVATLITNVGFPIAACVFMGYFVKDNQKVNRERFDNLNQQFIELTKSSVDAIANNTNAMENLTKVLESEVKRDMSQGIYLKKDDKD